MAHAKPTPKPKLKGRPTPKGRPNPRSFDNTDPGKGPGARKQFPQRPATTRKLPSQPAKTTVLHRAPNTQRATAIPRQGAASKAAARIRASKPVKGLEKLLKDFQDDPIAFALANPRKPIRQAQLPQGATPSGNRQLAATTFRSQRQRKPRRSAQVARRKR